MSTTYTVYGRAATKMFKQIGVTQCALAVDAPRRITEPESGDKFIVTWQSYGTERAALVEYELVGRTDTA